MYNNPNVSVHQEQRWQRSPITQAIVDRLRSMAEGDMVFFAELSDITHASITASNSYWQSAVNIVLKDYGVVVKRLNSECAVRLKNSEISKYSTSEHLKKLKGSTKKLTKQVDVVDIAQLNREQLNQYATAQSYAAMTQSLTSNPVKQEIERQSTQFNPNQLLDKDLLLKALNGLWKNP